MSQTRTLQEAAAAAAEAPPAEPRRRGYYDRRFFTEDRDAGQVFDPDGRRVFRAPAALLPTTARVLEAKLGDKAGDIFYTSGYRWGLKAMAEAGPRLRGEVDATFDELHLGRLLETWRDPLSAMGWGQWRHDYTRRDKGVVFVTLTGAPFGADSWNLLRLPAGLFAAAYSVLAGRELVGKVLGPLDENQVLFMVSGPAKAERAATLISEGHEARSVRFVIVND